MSNKSQHYHLELTEREFKALMQVLENYSFDCSVNTKTLSAIERVIRKITNESLGVKEEE